MNTSLGEIKLGETVKNILQYWQITNKYHTDLIIIKSFVNTSLGENKPDGTVKNILQYWHLTNTLVILLYHTT